MPCLIRYARMAPEGATRPRFGRSYVVHAACFVCRGVYAERLGTVWGSCRTQRIGAESAECTMNK